MIGSEEALRHILAVCRPLATEMVPLALTLDRVLAHDVVATDDLPPFDNSAMDGFALATHGVELQVGREFVVSGLQAAGDAMTDASQACEIMTGACLPTGLDAVVPVEQVSVLARDVDGRPQRIRLCATVGHRAHVRGRGEDVARDQLVLSAGQRVTPASRMLLAAIGVAETSMRPQVPAALLNTGRELVDEPRQPLASGQIRNCNGPYLTDRLREAGCCVVHQQTVGDDAQALPQRSIAALLQARG